MQEQGYITEDQYGTASAALPAPDDIEPPTLDSEAPYFTSWLRQQLVDRFGAAKTFFGGLKVKTTLDLRPAGGGRGNGRLLPRRLAADRRRGRDRQPQRRRSRRWSAAPTSRKSRSTWRRSATASPAPRSSRSSSPRRSSRGSRRKRLRVGAAGLHLRQEAARSLRGQELRGQLPRLGLDSSRDDLLRQLRLRPDRAEAWKARRSTAAPGDRRTAHEHGLPDQLSTNPAMVLGGLEEGVTPLEWTYAFTTLANNGDRVSGTLAPRARRQPRRLTEVTDQDGDMIKGGDNDSSHTQVIDAGVAEEAKGILRPWSPAAPAPTPTSATKASGARPARPTNNGDAWFCGATDEVTACVWVGYADTTTPMETEFCRRPGRRRHLPGADLGRGDLGLGGDRGRTRGRKAARKPSAQGPIRRRLRVRDRATPTSAGADEPRAAPEPKRRPAAPEAARSRRRRRQQPRPKQPRKPRQSPAAAAGSPPASRGQRPRDEAAAGERRSARGARRLW